MGYPMPPLERIATIRDMEVPARQRLPRFAYNMLAGGAGEDRGARRNEVAFERYLLMPRRFQGLAADQSITVLGRDYRQAFGIAPMGLANLFHPDTDLILARAAQAGGYPFVLSTSASTAIERIAAAAPDMSWYQLYHFSDPAISAAMLRRVWDCGVRTLVLTVDVPTGGRRNSAIRDGVSLPLRYTPRFLLDVAAHPRWALAMLRHGAPRLENYAPHAGTGDLDEASRHISEVMKHGLEWSDLDMVRSLWKGRLVIKGILSADDARECLRRGAEGIWVSNHGGRQLECAPASLDVLPAIREAIGTGVPLLFDGGVRTGEDIVKARALGADLCFTGRGFALPVAAYGAAGAAHAANILAEEIRVTLAQIGARSFAAVTRDWITIAPEKIMENRSSFRECR